jgi:endo-beta-N-acetylglucosaminidase D
MHITRCNQHAPDGGAFLCHHLHVWRHIIGSPGKQLSMPTDIRNAYKHGTSVDVFESASERRGADGIDARA